MIKIDRALQHIVIHTFSVYSSSPLCFIISGAIKPSVPPKPFIPDGSDTRLIP